MSEFSKCFHKHINKSYCTFFIHTATIKANLAYNVKQRSSEQRFRGYEFCKCTSSNANHQMTALSRRWKTCLQSTCSEMLKEKKTDFYCHTLRTNIVPSIRKVNVYMMWRSAWECSLSCLDGGYHDFTLNPWLTALLFITPHEVLVWQEPKKCPLLQVQSMRQQ